MPVDRATYITDDEDKVVVAIAEERKWSISQTIAELVRESPTFKQHQKPDPDTRPDAEKE